MINFDKYYIINICCNNLLWQVIWGKKRKKYICAVFCDYLNQWKNIWRVRSVVCFVVMKSVRPGSVSREVCEIIHYSLCLSLSYLQVIGISCFTSYDVWRSCLIQEHVQTVLNTWLFLVSGHIVLGSDAPRPPAGGGCTCASTWLIQPDSFYWMSLLHLMNSWMNLKIYRSFYWTWLRAAHVP